MFSIFLKLASGIIVDMKSMLADIRKGEAEFSDGVNPELKKTIENAIGKLNLHSEDTILHLIELGWSHSNANYLTLKK